MRKLIITLLIVKLLINFGLAQSIVKEYNSGDFDYVGIVNGKPVFRYIYSSADKKIDIAKGFHGWGLYFLEIDNHQLVLNLFNNKAIELGRTYFISDNYGIYWDYNHSLQLNIIVNNKSFIVSHKKAIYQKPSFCELNKNKVIYSVVQEGHLNTIEISNNNLSKSKLPVIGNNPYVRGNYLYFDYYHIDKNKATPCPVDLFRVKIDDWNNPELLAEFISDSWLPLNDSIVLMTLPVKGRGVQVLYNINNKTYVETEKRLPTTDIKFEGENYLLGIKRDERGNDKYVLQSFPDIPNKGYIQDNQREILPRVLDVNLPNKDKLFPGTFITDELLYNVTEEDLMKLSKEQLRVLRNAFYARQGYNFKSDDLKLFFCQFEWYNQLLESIDFFDIPNDEIVISPKDKERVELISKTENSK